ALAGCPGPKQPLGQDGGADAGVALDLSGDITRVETLALDRLARGSTQPAIIKLRRPLVDEQRNRVYFGGTLSPRLGVIDSASDTIVDTLDTGLHGYLSKQLALNRTTGMLYFTVIETAKLYKVAPFAKTTSAAVDVKGGGSFAVDSASDRVYAAAQGAIRVYDGNLQQMGTITAAGVLDVAVAPATRRLYATIMGQPSRVEVYDTTTLAQVTSYAMPAGTIARFVSVSGGWLYVSCANKELVIVDESSAQTTKISLPADVGGGATWGSSLYVMTGYPFPPGYLPDADGAYGVIEMLDPATGASKGSFRGGLQADGFSIHGSAGKMYVGNTGDSYVDVVDLATGTRTKRIDTATSIEDIVVRPSDGALVVRNRLGGGNSLLFVKDGAVSDAPLPGNWPTKTLFDEEAGAVYTMSHYESKVSAFSLATVSPLPSISLGTARLRSDGLSTAALDAAGKKLYAALPELGQLVVVDLASRTAGAPVDIPGFDKSKTDGPGLLHLAVNGQLGRVYLLSTPQKKLFVYDGSLSLLREKDLSASWPKPVGGNPLDMVFSDDDAGKLYLGSLVLDAEGQQVTGSLPEGEAVLAVYPAGDRLYVTAFGKPSSPTATDGHERIVELQRSSLAVLRRFDLSPFDVVRSAFAFDFQRGLAYAGYFETGTIDVVRFGEPRAPR
ncbi:MAG: YncE family protein, partial [Myxococcaceae bacterium]